MHLRVLAHAGRELCTQVNEGLLRASGRDAELRPCPRPAPRPRLPAQPDPALTELGPIQKFSCCTYLTFS